MIKCQQCRERDVELLSKWERFRNFMFYKVSYIFFADDFEDIKNQKYTQGYSDGRIDGVETERLRFNKEKEIYG